MKAILRQWSERIRSWLENLRKIQPQRRTPGIVAVPGQMRTLMGGKFKIPKIDWDKLYRKSFLYNSIAAVICGYFVADLLVASLSPWFPSAEAPRPRLNQVGEKRDFNYYLAALMPRGKPNLFNEKGLVPDNEDGAGNLNGPPVKTSLPLNLLGVIVIMDEKKSVASVEDKGANQVIAVRIGDPITAQTIVQQITEDRVVFVNHGTNRREFIELPRDQILATRKAAPVKPSAGGGITMESPNHFTIDRKEVDKAMENLNTILTDARCVPEFEDGKPAGYRCFQITPGSVYDKLGLKDNDVICGLNGENINEPTKAFQVLSSLKDASARNIQICIKRNGHISNYTYDIN